MPHENHYPGAPRWIKILGIIGAIALAAFVAVHLVTGGFGPIADHGRMLDHEGHPTP